MSKGHGAGTAIRLSPSSETGETWKRLRPGSKLTVGRSRRGPCSAGAERRGSPGIEDGRDVVQDYAGAVSWFRRAAEQGYASGQAALGFMYARGRGVVQDDTEAVRWERRAAEQSNARAQNNLGVSYRDGRGVVQDYGEAVRWFRRAAEQGDAGGQNNLGFMYSRGRGVRQDDLEAVRWHRRVRPNRDTPSGKTTSAPCTAMVTPCLRTTQKRSAGFAGRPTRATPAVTPTSAGCTRTVGACSGTAWKRSDGIVVQRSRAIRGRRSNSIVSGEFSCCGTRLITRRDNRWRRKRPSMDGPIAASGPITALALTWSGQ